MTMGVSAEDVAQNGLGHIQAEMVKTVSMSAGVLDRIDHITYRLIVDEDHSRVNRGCCEEWIRSHTD